MPYNGVLGESAVYDRESMPVCSEQPAVIANMSARVGSLGDNRLGGWYSYRWAGPNELAASS